jgi:hypothetical protein
VTPAGSYSTTIQGAGTNASNGSAPTTPNQTATVIVNVQ